MAVTIKDLSKLAGVSTATVSLVLSGKSAGRVSAARREKILELARKHGYRLNLAARGLSKGRTYRIAVCIEGALFDHVIIGNFSLYKRLGLLAREIRARGYSITLVQTDTTRPVEDICREISGEAADGFVFLIWPADVLDRVLFSLHEKRMPAVAVGTTLDAAAFTWTNVDRRVAFLQATGRLLAEGCSNLALVDTSGGPYAGIKSQAFLDVLARHGDNDGRRRIFAVDRPSFGAASRAVERALSAFPRLDGLLLSDNFYAEAVFLALGARGVTPGRDCRVIGFGETDLAERCSPRLSHYTLRNRDQVAFAVAALCEQVGDFAASTPRRQLLDPEYVHGET